MHALLTSKYANGPCLTFLFDNASHAEGLTPERRLIVSSCSGSCFVSACFQVLFLSRVPFIRPAESLVNMRWAQPRCLILQCAFNHCRMSSSLAERTSQSPFPHFFSCDPLPVFLYTWINKNFMNNYCICLSSKLLFNERCFALIRYGFFCGMLKCFQFE